MNLKQKIILGITVVLFLVCGVGIVRAQTATNVYICADGASDRQPMTGWLQPCISGSYTIPTTASLVAAQLASEGYTNWWVAAGPMAPKDHVWTGTKWIDRELILVTDALPPVTPPVPPPGIVLVPFELSWSAVPDATDYLIDFSQNMGGSWAVVQRVPATTLKVTVTGEQGLNCFRVRAANVQPDQEMISDPSGVVCLQKLADQMYQMDLVNGVESGLRPVYQKNPNGTRGPKIGDMPVGGVNNTTTPPFNRVKCSLADTFVHNTVIMYRVVDTRVDQKFLVGYVQGCKTYGIQ